MFRTPVLLLQMHEGAGQLYEALKKLVSGFGRLQPELLQYIVRFVVLLFVEADKVPDVK
jgi:hypothetical protein